MHALNDIGIAARDFVINHPCSIASPTLPLALTGCGVFQVVRTIKKLKHSSARQRKAPIEGKLCLSFGNL
jgi:hypothetical protein